MHRLGSKHDWSVCLSLSHLLALAPTSLCVLLVPLCNVCVCCAANPVLVQGGDTCRVFEDEMGGSPEALLTELRSEHTMSILSTFLLVFAKDAGPHRLAGDV
jgi:hypothetical protein